MSAIIEEFWIFSKDGTPYVNFFHENNEKDDFSFRAINSDGEILEKIKSILKSNGKEIFDLKNEFIEMNGSKFGVNPCLNDYLLIIYKSPLEVKRKQIQKICKTISSMIKNLYTVRDFRGWEGDLTLFDELNKKIDLYFKMSSL
ncbi:MAG: hypothetical protein ACFFFB_15495 [Candidatus Heimdallarchaeota archaeon]